ncbi:MULTISPECIES: YbaB/EbfC family nucleoid-associated protein [Nonomuraea]|uniref:YbaB/EbfC family nucleoid-associated protein n=1 Tax=Nonomuraea mangrovi TaxID=2316207 RepID=A0ABW4SMY8_9ACTN
MTAFDPDHLDRMVGESEQALRRLGEATTELPSITGSGQTPDGLVRATVTHAGRLLDLAMDPRAMRQDSGTLAESITRAVQAAQDDAARRCQELLTSLLGDATPAPFDLDAFRDRLDAARDAFAGSLAGHADDLNRFGRM